MVEIIIIIFLILGVTFVNNYKFSKTKKERIQSRLIIFTLLILLSIPLITNELYYNANIKVTKFIMDSSNTIATKEINDICSQSTQAKIKSLTDEYDSNLKLNIESIIDHNIMIVSRKNNKFLLNFENDIKIDNDYNLYYISNVEIYSIK